MDKTDDFIFKGLSVISVDGSKLTAAVVKQLIDKYSFKARIKKKISPHSFSYKSVTTILEYNVK
jgi:site-specific recombinase XerD